MRLFELCGENKDLSFSPFVWRTRMALAHKGLSYERVPCGFLEKEGFAPSQSKTVPVLDDDGVWVGDSWDIACYLEDTYSDTPSIFGGDVGRALALFINNWAGVHLVRPMFYILAPDIPHHLTKEDAQYFKVTREKFFGHPLDELIAQREENMNKFKSGLGALRATLKQQEFLSGSAPAYADYIVFAAYQWARQVGTTDFLTEEKYIHPWFEKMLDLYDGLGRNAKMAHSK